MLGETLSNPDAELRNKMRVEFTKLHLPLRDTIIFVTHDQIEAVSMAFCIVVLRNGRIA